MKEIETIILDNGLKVYLYPDKRRHTTFFQLITLVGGLDKDFKVNDKEYHFQDGIAHILEHYVVECNSVGNFLKELGSRQMNTNASTYYNMTAFYFSAVENINFGIKTLLNGIYNVDFDKDKLEKLKNPIYQEIRGRLDNKFYHSNIMTLNNLFNNINFRSIGGSIEEVKNTTVDDLKIYYEAFYQPKNQFIVVGGNFSKNEVMNEINSFFQKKKIQEKKVDKINHNESITVKKREDILYFPTPLDYLEVSFKIDISKKTSKEKLDLDFYLGCFYNQYFGNTSKTHKELIDKKIITTGISCSDIRIENFLIINIGAYTNDVSTFKKTILNVIKELNYFDKDKFELDKKSAIIRMILRDENIMKMIIPFIDNVVNFDYPYLDNINDLNELEFKDYVKAIRELDFSNYTVTHIKEKKAS